MLLELMLIENLITTLNRELQIQNTCEYVKLCCKLKGNLEAIFLIIIGQYDALLSSYLES